VKPFKNKEVHMDCLLCGSDRKKIFTRVESFGFPLVYYQCKNCGLIYQSRKESQAANPEFYRRTYRRIYQACEEPTPKDLWVQEQRAQHLNDILRPHLEIFPEKVLDIGASAGILLQQFRNSFGSEVVGVEPGDAYRAYAEESGIEMKESIGALLASDHGKFDLVSMSHVLEHLTEPVEDLKRIKLELLRDGGTLLLEVPNFYAHDSYELAHLACYTPHTLREVLKQAGFRLVFLKRHGVPRSKLLNLYLTGVAKVSPEAFGTVDINKDRFVGLKRNVSMLYRRLMQKISPHKAWLPIPVIDQE
jgi:2-polyprenyl-3-methyl-5-hydroxy-6-metoxy-1,4-benzoquinol methylase